MNVPCDADPDRWSVAETDDPDARQLCRMCPRRVHCAKDALDLLETVHATGIYAAVFLPRKGRARPHAIAHLQATAAHLPLGQEVA